MNIEFDFTDRAVVVTGAAQGIGLELARMFRNAHAIVAAWDLDLDRLDAARGDDKGFVPVQANVADATSVAKAFDETVDAIGAPAIVVNNAGIARDTVVWKMSDDDWSAVLGVHLTGTFNVTRACIP